MFLWSDILARQERAQDLLREAEQERLARQALAGRERPRVANRMLSWLGRRLIEWGVNLQKRGRASADSFTSHSDTPQPRAAA